MAEQSNNILIYQANDGTTKLEVKLYQETSYQSQGKSVVAEQLAEDYPLFLLHAGDTQDHLHHLHD